MNLFKDFQVIVRDQLEALVAAENLPEGLDFSRVTVEPPRDPSHGDLATNAAMVLAKPAGRKPRDVAEMLAEELRRLEGVESVEIAGPGFINLRLSDDVWYRQLAGILRAGSDFGSSDMGRDAAVNVEYVSANPTGPLTVGHARGAVVGDALASLLEKAGYRVLREYYVNDAGGQVDTLARSAYLRYREALGETIAEIPPGLYPGEYLKDVGAALAGRDGERWLDRPEEEWLPEVRAFAIDAMMGLVRADLQAIGIEHDLFVSERALVEAGAVDAVIETLQARDLIYTGVLEPPKGKAPEDWEPRPQTLFRATAYGDDTDRPIRKSDGSWTYFANDMANHLDKYRRGYPTMLQVWGADHGGYVKRMKAAVAALTNEEGKLHVVLCQLVRLMRGGEELKMSKRSGNFITLREVVEEVGKDVLRFMMLTRKPDAPLDFDLEKVLEQSKDNPVFYVQYAHARAHSVLRHATEAFPAIDRDPRALAEGPLHRLTDPSEVALIKLMSGWPRLVESAAEAYEPHRIAFYLHEVAAAFHGLWTKGKEDTTLRFLVPEDPELTGARLALLQGMAAVIASGLLIFGVEPVEEMR
ncbi:arginine--tRNA ligase [Aquibaculum sediminis]|uniref:arginine--tRNA ligase n=1 Tax=Aquibaculum sediminis TaxID=3231907 RepID=UPI003451E7C9